MNDRGGNALSWRYWPRVRTAVSQAQWREVAQQLRTVARVIVLDQADLPRARWQAWCATVRSCGLISAICMDPGDVDASVIAAVAQCGPILLVLRATIATQPDAWSSALRHLAIARIPTLRWTTLGAPLCQLLETQADLQLQERLHPTDPRCRDCGVRAQCPGSHPEQPVAPRPAAVSNQFDLVLAAQPHDTPSVAIQLPDGQRAQAVVTGEVDPAVWQAAVERGQLYLDVSTTARLDDFAEQLRLLAPPTGPDEVWQVQADQPFDAEERKLQALLITHLLAQGGLVVDVGAGPVRYVAPLRSAALAGTLRYVAVEPDEAHIARSFADFPEGTFVRGVGEALPLADGCADAVLFLRSWNHLRDVPTALREAARVLKDGGLLLAVDNVAFGLVRTPAQLARAHAITVDTTPFEHYRNDDATTALGRWRATLGDALTVEICEDVAAGTSNQWILMGRLGKRRDSTS